VFPSAESPGRGALRQVQGDGAATGIVELERADRVEYLENDRRVELTGHVRVKFEDSLVAADRVRVDLARNTLEAEGHLTWDGPDHHATGSRMTYDMKSKTGQVDDVTLRTGSWICTGKRVEEPEENTVLVSPGVITTCDAPRPHYAIHCKTLRIRLNKDLRATQVTVLVGSTPVFWLPVLVTPLREFRLPFEAQVGRTHELGPYLRTSPAYSFTARTPGQAHLDYFANKGWGYGVTQEMDNDAGSRIARLHLYRIAERAEDRPGIPRRRWEADADGSRTLWHGARVSTESAYLSDPHMREDYGNARLLLPTTAGERRMGGLFTQQLPGAWISLAVDRTDTLRLSNLFTTATQTGRYAVSNIRAPRLEGNLQPIPLWSWLSASARSEAGREFTWQNGWYVNRAGITPALEAYARIPHLGAVTITPRVSALWRDRGDRVLHVENGAFSEDLNRGGVYRAEDAASIRRPVALGVEAELSHTAAKRLNKIGYDPFGYHGLESNRAQARVDRRFGDTGSAQVTGSYDLRDHQDPVRRRFGPVTPRVDVQPHRLLALSADADYDTWFHRWRGATAQATLGQAGTGPHLTIRPRFTDNRLPLPAATTTSQEYLIAGYLYGNSFQQSADIRRIFLVDADIAFPLTALIQVAGSGQYDADRGRLNFFTVTVVRNLHCWELAGTFQRFASGELRFNASLGLTAFPGERVPLIGL
jgi:hypothetical protein